MKPIETERLLLRPWRLEDAADMYAYAKNPNVGPNAGWKPHESVEESKAILESWIHSDEEEDIWAIVPKETGRACGSIGLHQDGRFLQIFFIIFSHFSTPLPCKYRFFHLSFCNLR